MPYTTDQQYAKTFKIMSWSEAVKYFNIAIITRRPTEVEDPQ